MTVVRRAGPLDARAMAGLLNEIIAAGGTTALQRPVSPETLCDWMEADPRAVWHVAENAAGDITGFQWVAPHPELGADAGQIATFTRAGQTGMGIGSALWEWTRRVAAAEGYTWIEAEIRADNAGGLAYYQSRGFEDVALRRGVRLEDGTLVDKVLKRFDL
jgi:L-amino acid N-acyltransferase YncA